MVRSYLIVIFFLPRGRCSEERIPKRFQFSLPSFPKPVFHIPNLHLPVFQKPSLQLPAFQKPSLQLPVFQKPTLQIPVFQKPTIEIKPPNRALVTIRRTQTVTELVTVLPTCSVSIADLPDCGARAKRLLNWNMGYPDYFVVLNPEPVHTFLVRTIVPESPELIDKRLGVPDIEPSISEESQPRFILGLHNKFGLNKNKLATIQYTNVTVSVTSTDTRQTVTVRPVCRLPNSGNIPECEDEGSGEQPVPLGRFLNPESTPEFWTEEMEDNIFSGEEDEFMLVKPLKRSLDTSQEQKKKPAKECEPGWKMYCDRSMNCKCLTIPDRYATWNKAQRYCEEMQSEFVSIKNNKENKFLSDLLEETSISKVFVGARRFNQTNFQWLDGTPVKFDKWEDGEPVNDCAVVLQDLKGNRWGTVKCEDTGQFVCRKNAVWQKAKKK